MTATIAQTPGTPARRTAIRPGKGHREYGRRVRQPGGGGKLHGARRVWFERPADRCECHHGCPCPRAKAG